MASVVANPTTAEVPGDVLTAPAAATVDAAWAAAAATENNGEKKKNLRGSKSSRAGLEFPIGRVARFLKKQRVCSRIGVTAPPYLTAVMEYLAAEMLTISGDVAKAYNKKRIIPRHISLATKQDADFDVLLRNVTIAGGGVAPLIQDALKPKSMLIAEGKKAAEEQKTRGAAKAAFEATVAKGGKTAKKASWSAATNGTKKTTTKGTKAKTTSTTTTEGTTAPEVNTNAETQVDQAADAPATSSATQEWVAPATEANITNTEASTTNTEASTADVAMDTSA